MKRIGMTAALAAAAFVAVPAESRADVRAGVGIQVGDGYNRTHRNTWSAGYGRGFEDGQREGIKDLRHHERFSFWDEGRYRDGDVGYRGWMGPRYEYVSAYRRGFEEGYRKGYRRYDYSDRRYDRY